MNMPSKLIPAAGWRTDNPVAPTRSESVRTQRGRLSIDAFRAIHSWSLEWRLPERRRQRSMRLEAYRCACTTIKASTRKHWPDTRAPT